MCEPGVVICGRVKAEDTRGPDFVSKEVMEEVMGEVGTTAAEGKQEKRMETTSIYHRPAPSWIRV